jgi:membrane protein
VRSAAWELLRGVADRVSEHGLTDRAAALTYYGFLSLFPALIVAVALLGLLGSYPETYESIRSTLQDAAPGNAIDTIDEALDDALRSPATAGSLLGVGLVLSVYSASSGTGAALRAVRAVYGTSERQSFWRSHLDRLKLTFVVGLMLLLAFTAILVAGPIFSSIADEAGLDESVKGAISLIRWPVGVLALVATALIIYRSGAGRQVSLRGLLPGAISASLLWVVASIGFNVYLSHFGSYDATYGTLGAVIVLLIWMWLGSLALLCGAALNVQLEETAGERAAR